MAWRCKMGIAPNHPIVWTSLIHIPLHHGDSAQILIVGTIYLSVTELRTMCDKRDNNISVTTSTMSVCDSI